MRWVFAYAQGYVCQQIQGQSRPGQERLCVSFPVAGFDQERLNVSTVEFLRQAEQHEDHLHLLLLVKACASRDDYLGRIAAIWAVIQGYADPSEKAFVDRRGRAIIQPATVSNLESALSYLELLLRIKLDGNAGLVGKAYKLRCIAAHNGGIVDQDTLKVFPRMIATLGKPIRLDWKDLPEFLNAIGECCETIEEALPSKEKRSSELKIILHGLIQAKVIGPLDEVKARTLLTTTFGFNNLPDRKRLAAILGALR